MAATDVAHPTVHPRHRVAPAKRQIESPLSAIHEQRDTWQNSYEFTLSIINFSVDLSNLWRFPFVCYKCGGAVPLLYMELALGQLTKSGMITAWTICPVFKGVGISCVMMAYYVNFYYPTTLAVAVMYLISCFSNPLPWSTCKHAWNTAQCVNISYPVTADQLKDGTYVSSAEEFYERKILEIHLSAGLHDLGLPKWDLVLCVILTHAFFFAILFRGIRMSGKFAWITVTLPFLSLFVLFVQASVLPGSWDGLTLFLKPKWHSLISLETWIEAALQVVLSFGLGFGTHLAYASYNKFHNNIYMDCLITAAVNAFTSCLSSVVIFCFLGYMAKRQGWDVMVTKALSKDPGKVFQTYPEAIALLPTSWFFAVLYFVLIIAIGSGVMGSVESVITATMDEFHLFYYKNAYSRICFTATVIIPPLMINMVNVTRGGGYAWVWFDTFTTGFYSTSLLIAIFFQAIAISWFYGIQQFSEDIKEMLGFYPGIFWRLCWKFISPVMLLVIICFALIFPFSGERLMYKEYEYPIWSIVVGWLFGLSSIVWIPLWAAIYLIKTKGSFKKRIALAISPEREHRSLRRRWRRGRGSKRFSIAHWLRY